MNARLALASFVLVVASCGGDPGDADAPGADAGAFDAAGTDAAGIDGGPRADVPLVVADTGPRPDGGELGDLVGEMHASREVARVPATGAPASDSETVLTAEVSASVTSVRWQVLESETGALVAEGSTNPMTFTCPAGRAAYDVVLFVGDGTSEVRYRERRLVTCTLPRVAAGRTVHDVDLGVTSYFPNGRIGTTVVMPGDVIRVHGSFARSWVFLNLAGTEAAPIHIINDGPVVNTSNQKLLHLVNCRHVILDGFGDDSVPYGFVLDNDAAAGEQALFVRAYTEGTSTIAGSTDIEIFGVHVRNTPGSGISVDTHGYPEFNRGNWRFDDLRVHHNLVENTGNEGFYLGYTRDFISAAGPETELAYQIYDARVYRNVIRGTGNDGLQVCNLIEGLEIHDNHVSDVAHNGDGNHASSLQYNSGNAGFVYDNVFLGGAGANLQGGCTGGSSWFFSNVFERGDDAPAATNPSVVYVISGAREDVTYHFFDNTFRTRDAHGITLNFGPICNDGRPAAGAGIVAVNNVFVFPDGMVSGREPAVFRYDSPHAFDPPIVSEPNVVRHESTIAELCFADVAAGDFSIGCATSPALAGDALSLAALPGTMPSVLPGGFFADRTGRVFTDPPNYGAYQLFVP